MISTYSKYDLNGLLRMLKRMENEQEVPAPVIALAAEFIGGISGDTATNVFVDAFFSPFKSRELKISMLITTANDPAPDGCIAEVRFFMENKLVDATNHKSNYHYVEGTEAEACLYWEGNMVIMGKSPLEPNISSAIYRRVKNSP